MTAPYQIKIIDPSGNIVEETMTEEFTLAGIYSRLGCSMFEIVYIDSAPESIMLVDEEGWYADDPQLNELATSLGTSHGDIVGTVIICPAFALG